VIAIPVNAERSYQIEVGVDWRLALEDRCKGRKQVVVLCSEGFPVETTYPTILIPDGELGKELSTLENLYQHFSDLKISRDTLIVAIGGGAVTDVAGFAAATWQRGIDWLAIPTTLAGMVDAAIGGKTGINFKSGKNLIGSFHSPIAVLADLSWLLTLAPRDLSAGLAEVIKTGFIKDAKILELIELIQTQKDSIETQKEIWIDLISRSISVKAQVVSTDFKENFEREILNYGHTLGHAIEKHSDYQLRHGEAVAIGLCFAAELSKISNGLSDEVVNKHYQLLKKVNLTTTYPINAWDELFVIMKGDKKNRAGTIRLVGLVDIGTCNRIENPDEKLLRTVYERIST
jgi:3-dehydroquinate synthase